MTEHAGTDPGDHTKNAHEMIEMFGNFTHFLDSFGAKSQSPDGSWLSEAPLSGEDLERAREIFASEGLRSPDSVVIAIVEAQPDVDLHGESRPKSFALELSLGVASQEVMYHLNVGEGHPLAKLEKDVVVHDESAFETIEDVEFIANAATVAHDLALEGDSILDEVIKPKEVHALQMLGDYLTEAA